MATLIKLAGTLAFAALVGLGATDLALRGGQGFGALRAGAWTAWPRAGTPDADPYARAALARSGAVSLGLGEGLMFLARSDDAGRLLSGRCSYVVSGPMPTARAWTLTPTSLNGLLVDNAARRYGFTSQEIVRNVDGGFRIVIGRSARAGNWLPLGDAGPFLLALRLYDTPLSATAAVLGASQMPSIAREACQ